MSTQDDKRRRTKVTLKFKLEAVKLVKGGPHASVTARVLGIPKATLGNWIRASEKGELSGAGDRPVSFEQMVLARLRAELARVKMKHGILKIAATAQRRATKLFCAGQPGRYQPRTKEPPCPPATEATDSHATPWPLSSPAGVAAG